MNKLIGYVQGQKVFVYFNLHKKLFSVRDQLTGLVVDHTNHITLRDVVFKVSEAGRLRVLREKRKNVHAGILGYVTDNDETLTERAFYNPYKYDSFVDANGQKLSKASIVALIKGDKATIVFKA